MGEIRFPYEPRPHFQDFHARSNRWACLVCHRRMGKTVAVINDVIAKAVYSRKQNPRYAYIAPFYRQAKDVAWEYLKYYAGDAIKGRPRESELRVELFNGAWITLYGADNPDALRGLYFDGVVLDEYGDCRPSLWGEVLLPALADRRGWAVFIGTPKGRNHFYDTHQRAEEKDEWYSLLMKASQSKLLPKEELDAMREEMSEDEYAQELECSFEAAVKGTFYSAQISILERDEKILPNYPDYDPALMVHVAADLGWRDSTAMWFWQEGPNGVQIIDYEEHSGEPIAFYADLLNSKGYDYEELCVPHDAKAKTLQTGRSTVEQLLDYQFPVRVVPRLRVQQGIDAARAVLPHCRFNYNKCRDGVEALRAYRRAFDDKKQALSNAPLHDWSSHGADAFRYLALIAKERIVELKAEPEAKPLMVGPGQYTMDELWAAHDLSSARFNRTRIA